MGLVASAPFLFRITLFLLTSMTHCHVVDPSTSVTTVMEKLAPEITSAIVAYLIEDTLDLSSIKETIPKTLSQNTQRYLVNGKTGWRQSPFDISS